MQKLLDAKWRMIHALLFEHETKGKLYRDETRGAWFWEQPGSKPKKIGETLKEAIPHVI